MLLVEKVVMTKLQKTERFIADQMEMIGLLMPHVSNGTNESFMNGVSAALGMIQFYMSNTEDDPKDKPEDEDN